jgi:hypothetical protein
MDPSHETPASPPELTAAIADARSVAREQIMAAWQILEAGWRESIDHIFEERFTEIEARLRGSFDRAVSDHAAERIAAARLAARGEAQREWTEHWSQTARRLKDAESRDVWIHTLLDATAPFCPKAALFLLTPRGFKLDGARGANPPDHVAAAEIPLSSAPAFGSVVETSDTVIAQGTPRELSQTVAALLGDASEKRVFLFPVTLRQQVVAVLYAEAESTGTSVDVSGLELLASLASASMQATETVTMKPPQAELVRLAPPIAAEPPSSKPSRPAWSELPASEQEQHLKAQRFARTQIATMLLHRVQQVRTGRASNNLYEALKEEIDAGRQEFRLQFLENCPSMVDYYHHELLRTLAKDSLRALGPDYPGPLVA